MEIGRVVAKIELDLYNDLNFTSIRNSTSIYQVLQCVSNISNYCITMVSRVYSNYRNNSHCKRMKRSRVINENVEIFLIVENLGRDVLLKLLSLLFVELVHQNLIELTVLNADQGYTIIMLQLVLVR